MAQNIDLIDLGDTPGHISSLSVFPGSGWYLRVKVPDAILFYSNNILFRSSQFQGFALSLLPKRPNKNVFLIDGQRGNQRVRMIRRA